MKKLMKLFVVVFVVSVLVLTLGACNKSCKHELVEKPAVPATCTEQGSIAHWACSKCEKLFADESAARELAAEDVAVPAAGHDWGEWGNSTATCVEDGKLTRSCKNCTETEERPASKTGHSFMLPPDGTLNTSCLVPAKDASCSEAGNLAYYKCELCNKYFVVENGNLVDKGSNISAVQVPASDHSFIKDGKPDPDKLVAAVGSSCAVAGTVAHYQCEDCHHYFVEDNGALKDVGTDEAALKAALLKHSFQNADGSLIVTKVVPAKANACGVIGNLEYYLCEDCGNYYVVEEGSLSLKGSELSAVQLPALVHSFMKNGAPDPDKLVAEKAPSCTENGNDAHYKCDLCGHYFTVGDGGKLNDVGTAVTAVQRPATNHSWGTAQPVIGSIPAQHSQSCTNDGCTASRTDNCLAGSDVSHDASGHWYACTVCGGKTDFSAHQIDDLNCDVCGWVSTKAGAKLTVGNAVSYHATLKAAVAALDKQTNPASVTLLLLKNETADSIGTAIDSDYCALTKSVVIDLGGRKLTLEKGLQLPQGVVTIKNGTLDCTKNDVAAIVNKGCTLTLENVTVTGSGSRTSAVVAKGGETILNGVTLSGTSYMVELIYESPNPVALKVMGQVNITPACGGVLYAQYLSERPEDWREKVTVVVDGNVMCLKQEEFDKINHTASGDEKGFSTWELFLSSLELVGEAHVHAPSGKWKEVEGDESNHYALCSCGQVLNVSEAHKWTTVVSYTPATCAAAGERVYECTCGATKKEVLEKTNKHSWGEWDVKYEATCETPGEQSHTCSVCKKVEPQTIPALGHDYVENVCSRGDSTLDETAVLNLIFGMTTSETLDGTYKLEGNIESIADAASNSKDIVLKFGEREVTIYHAKGNGVDKLVVGDYITVVGKITYVSNAAAGAPKNRITDATVTRVASPADKVELDKAVASALNNGYRTAADTTLPTQGKNGTTISWAVDADQPAWFTITNNVIDMTGLPEHGDFKIHITATISHVAEHGYAAASATVPVVLNVSASWELVTVKYQNTDSNIQKFEVLDAVGEKIDPESSVYAGSAITLSFEYVSAEYKVSYRVNGGAWTVVTGESKEIYVDDTTIKDGEILIEVKAEARYTVYETIAELYPLTGNARNGVRVSGVVTLLNGKNFYLQAETNGVASGSAVYVYPSASLGVAVGDRVTVSGDIKYSSGLMRLENVVLNGTPVHGTPIAPEEIEASDFATMDATYASKYVTLKGITKKVEVVDSKEVFSYVAGTDVAVTIYSYNPATTLLGAIDADTTFDIVGAVISWYNAKQISVFNVDQLAFDFDVTVSVAAKIAPGDGATVTVSIPAPYSTYYTQVAYSSSDTTIVTVDASGNVVAGSVNGTATITATIGGNSGTAQINVDSSLTRVSVNFSEQIVVKGESTPATFKSVVQNSDLYFNVVLDGDSSVGSVIYKVSATDTGTPVPFDAAQNAYKLSVGTNESITVEIEIVAKAGWWKVENISDVAAGDVIVLVGEASGKAYAMSTQQNNNNRGLVEVTIANGQIVGVAAGEHKMQEVTLVAAADGKYKLAVGEKYLYTVKANGSYANNYLRSGTGDDSNYLWTLGVDATDNTLFTFTAQAVSGAEDDAPQTKILRFNSGNNMFATYASGQTAFSIYKLYDCAAGAHNVAGAAWQYDATNYWKECANCFRNVNVVAHGFTSASSWATPSPNPNHISTVVIPSTDCTVICGGSMLAHDWDTTNHVCALCGITSEYNVNVTVQGGAADDWELDTISNPYAAETVTFKVKQNNSEKVLSGSGIKIVIDGTEPEQTVSCTAVSGQENTFSFTMPTGNITITILLMDKPAGGVTYYTKVEDMDAFNEIDLSKAKFLIVYEASGYVLNGYLDGNIDKAGNYITVTVTDGKIQRNQTLDDNSLTIAKIPNSNNYSVLTAGEKACYIGNTAAGNGLSTNASSAIVNAISFANGNVLLQGTGTTKNGSTVTTTLQFYLSGDSSRFRYYASSQKGVQLYVYVDTTAE